MPPTLTVHHNSDGPMVSLYFKGQFVSTISYSYTSSITSQSLTIDMHSNIHLSIIDPNAKPTDCACHNSQFKYSPVDHVITIDLNIIDNTYPWNPYLIPKVMCATVSKWEIQLQTTIEVCNKMDKSKNQEVDNLDVTEIH